MQSNTNRMKKIILAILPIMIFSLCAKAQISFNATADTAYYSLVDDGVGQKAKISLSSAYSTDVDVRWRVKGFYLPDPGTWQSNGLCDWVTCVPFESAAGWTTSSFPANSSQDIFVDMKRLSGAITGCSQIEVEIDEVNGSANRVVTIVHTSATDKSLCGAVWPTSVKNTVRELVNVYPNPANNYINLNVVDKNVKTVQLGNIIGRQIQRINISNSSSNVYQMSLQALPKGIYILQFKNELGKVIGVQRITKK